MDPLRGKRALLRHFLVAVPLTLSISGALAAHAPAVGDAAPSFLRKSLDGHAVSLGSYGGKVVVVSFWATWCPPCRAELPILANIQKAGKGEIQVVAVNIESRDVFRKVAKILADYQLLLTNDVDGRGFNSYGAKALPHLVVVGKDGRIISVREGYGVDELSNLADELTRALAVSSEPPPVAATQ